MHDASLSLAHALPRAKGHRPRLAKQRLTVLVASDGYHAQQEVVRALRALGHNSQAVDCSPPAAQAGAQAQGDGHLLPMAKAIAAHAPDLVVSINYVGFDRLGLLDHLLMKLAIPCAIWLLDSPLFFAMGLLRHANPQTVTFAWDRTHAAALSAWTGRAVHHLPLGCEPSAFAAGLAMPADDALPCSFVGSSLVPLEGTWRARLSEQEAALGANMAARLLTDRAALHSLVPNPAPPIDRRTLAAAYANCVASRAHRKTLLRAAPQAELCVFGDGAWQTELPQARAFGEVAYGADLAALYRRSAVNLNVTILQMPSAVNQRVFDVPAAGGFVLTDRQAELHELFVEGEEVVSYDTAQELTRLVAYFAKRPRQRAAISARARKRIEREHTYLHRVDALLRTLRQTILGQQST